VKTLISPLLVLAALAVFVAGCGNSGGGSSAAPPKGGGGVSGISVGNCLNNDENFLVQPSETTLDGQSPAGVSFTMILYRNDAAAQKAGAKKSKKTTAIVENAVIDFKGNPSIYAGAPPAKISQVELAAIKRCIDKSKSS
jgi:hypothetical protein